MTTSYLDYNATAPIRPQALEAMTEAAREGGNPSSVHRAGRAARARVETARKAVADLVGRRPAEVVFTSGGTEADCLALAARPWSAIWASAIEHDAILVGLPAERRLPVSKDGVVDLEAVDRALAPMGGAAGGPEKGAPVLLSIMWVNNETGVIQPIPEIRRLAQAHGAVLHVDAVQGVGRLDPAALDGVDLITVSAHKLGGPPGVGALILRDGLPVTPMIAGGGQEKGRRSGTENTPAIAGFGTAAALAARERQDEAVRLGALRDRLEAEIRALAPEVRIMGAAAARVGNTANIALPGVPAETQVMTLDLDGVLVSAGSACSSGKVTASHVLAAMHPNDPIAGHAIRVSLGWATTGADIDRFLAAWRRMRDRLSPAARAA